MEYCIFIELSDWDSARKSYSFFKAPSCEPSIQESGYTDNFVTIKGAEVSTVKEHSEDDSNQLLSIIDMRLKDDKILAQWMGHGTIRLFKCGQSKTEQQEHGHDDTEVDLIHVPGDNSMCCILFTPSYLSSDDLLHWFLGPMVLDQVSHFRLVKLHDKKGEYMVLMKFRNHLDAKRFQTEFNGKQFNSLEPETCHVVFVKEIVFKEKLFPDPNKDFPYLLRDPFTNGSGMVELPTCPVCLERMDSDTTGLITTACQHTFHCQCLDQWKGGRCPVCRYSNAKEPLEGTDQANCNVCGSGENLWVCLICGHMGCGRYNSKHAIQHYETTSHCFSMDITTNRVWDYAGDNYVHRLVQNEVDGKLVEIGGSNKRNQEYHLEYVQVLVSQLESQREYYENKLETLAQKNTSSITVHNLSAKFDNLKIDFDRNNKKYEARICVLQNHLKEEKLISRGLRENLDHMTKECERLTQEKDQQKSEVAALQETMNDLMLHFQSIEQLSQDPEAAQGTIVIQNPDRPTPKKLFKKKKPPHRFGK
ncbi:Etp1p Ecym_7244 [Eremothecium cymbalariae DBVPG|uniref:BRCA1-associated protein n=1 Tax=Eremothecium cymbalariae (strain CBS 270.75 / DBVPG 7215 / KCTC 17166 / NRRL Y-17582) TaxID=931890 RepID=G8JW74_ERECY|nr:hypothetical protein Ecym_7244 [Eremothecium cymbalariae DBVPG\